MWAFSETTFDNNSRKLFLPAYRSTHFSTDLDILRTVMGCNANFSSNIYSSNASLIYKHIELYSES